MPIVVKHDASVTPLTQLAYGAGYGQTASKRLKEERASNQAERERARQDQQAREKLAHQEHAAEANREHQLDLQDRAQEDRLEAAELAARIGEQSAIFEHKLKIGDIGLFYTAKHQAKWEKYNRAIQKVRESDDFRPKEKAEIISKLRAKQLGIEREGALKADTPTPAERLEQTTFLDPKTGMLIGWDKDGVPKKVGDDKSVITSKDVADAYDSAYKGMLNPSSETLPKHEDVMARAVELLQLKKALNMPPPPVNPNLDQTGQYEDDVDPETGALVEFRRKKPGMFEDSKLKAKEASGVKIPDLSKVAPATRPMVIANWNNIVGIVNTAKDAAITARAKVREATGKVAGPELDGMKRDQLIAETVFAAKRKRLKAFREALSAKIRESGKSK